MTVVSRSTVTVQAPAPLQAPLQPTSRAPVPGMAVNVRVAPVSTWSVQLRPQSKSDGELTRIVPELPVALIWMGS